MTTIPLPTPHPTPPPTPTPHPHPIPCTYTFVVSYAGLFVCVFSVLPFICLVPWVVVKAVYENTL